MDLRSAFQLRDNIADRVRSEVEHVIIQTETYKPTADQVLQEDIECCLRRQEQRKEDRGATVEMIRQEGVGDIARLICTGGNPAVRAEGLPDLGVQQSQEISNFRCRPDGRAGVANVIFLLDGDGRSDVVEPIDVWAVE